MRWNGEERLRNESSRNSTISTPAEAAARSCAANEIAAVNVPTTSGRRSIREDWRERKRMRQVYQLSLLFEEKGIGRIGYRYQMLGGRRRETRLVRIRSRDFSCIWNT